MEPITLILIIVGAIALFWIGYTLGTIIKDHEWTTNLPKIRADATKKSREILTGNFSEQLAPYMPDFPFSPTECRFIGKPIDLVVFKGTDLKEPEEIVFVEIKSGNAKLSASERKLKQVVMQKKISWYEYRAPN